MQDANRIVELAEKLECAEGADRELDREIEPSLGFIPVDAKPCKGGWIIDGKPKDSPRYTASLDAALTLVPEGWPVFHLFNCHIDPTADRWIWEADLAPHRGYEGILLGQAATPALALAAAALKARATDGGRG